MNPLTDGKREGLEKLSDKNGIIRALAIDQRGSLKKMISDGENLANEKSLQRFKALVSETLTPYASAILLDPEYGWPAADVRAKCTGLLMAYEKTGYDASAEGRLPDLLAHWSVKRLKNRGADGIKVLLYYDVDESPAINDQKQAFIERIGDECRAEDLPFFLEIVTYDARITDVLGEDYAKVKPHKVIEAMKVFSHDTYGVDVLKVEVPVNMAFVEGFGEKTIYTKEQAAEYFRAQSAATDLPFIFLSAGVSAELFRKTLYFAKESGSRFNGVLCGRATWKDGATKFAKEGEKAAEDWLHNQGRENIESLNEVLQTCATPWQRAGRFAK
ncbi:tagatose-bisphosphate aldolase [Caenibacillus caldisaponilyticus]|uniref:tagatose-bisphosphate aldolase n=1 Tax=Caenibacillus caldisaponilyticus TaxID=1674942 RepID=UPI000988397C|nr:tagatose-bisphosphate aldolase [Caenibacillus caldisaponilyticus]